MLLNFSGLMAFVVAMVPTVPDARLRAERLHPQTPVEIAAAVRNNIWSLVVVAVSAAVVAAWLKRGAMTRDPTEHPTPRSVVITVVCGAVLLGELTLFLLLRDRFIALSHGIAAGTMVAGVIAVMVLSALRAEERHQSVGSDQGATYKRIYIAIAVALAVALAVTVLTALTLSGLRPPRPHLRGHHHRALLHLLGRADEGTVGPARRHRSATGEVRGRVALWSWAIRRHLMPTMPRRSEAQKVRARRRSSRVGPSGACSRSVACASPRVAERVTIATGTPSWCARRTKR